MNTLYTIIVHAERGILWSEVQELPGCLASGVNIDELLEATAEAIKMSAGEPGQDEEQYILPWNEDDDAKS